MSRIISYGVWVLSLYLWLVGLLAHDVVYVGAACGLLLWDIASTMRDQE